MKLSSTYQLKIVASWQPAAAQPLGMSHGSGVGLLLPKMAGASLDKTLHYFGIKMWFSTDRNDVRRCIIEGVC
jgi:hypothetical protein